MVDESHEWKKLLRVAKKVGKKHGKLRFTVFEAKKGVKIEVRRKSLFAKLPKGGSGLAIIRV